MESVTVIGAGLAGSECAWQLAQRGIPVVLREMKPGEWRLSLRTGTDGRVSATEACRLLGGGGHALAAGATVSGSLPEVKDKILAAIDAVKAW